MVTFAFEGKISRPEGPFDYHLLNSTHASVVMPDRPEATDVTTTEQVLKLVLSDEGTVSVPLVWYPRLAHATQDERDKWELVGQGQGIRWSDLDEDLSVEGVIAGRPSGESRRSFERWLEARRSGRSVLLYDLIRDGQSAEEKGQ